MNSLKVEIETVKGRKMSFSHSYYSPHRVLDDGCHHNTEL